MKINTLSRSIYKQIDECVNQWWICNNKYLNDTLGHWQEVSRKFTALPKHSHVLHAFPWRCADFHLIKVYDVIWNTRSNKLIHNSVTFYHKRLQSDCNCLERRRVLHCFSSHGNIGDIPIVTGFSSCVTCWSRQNPPTATPSTQTQWPVRDRIPPVLVAVGESAWTDLTLPPWK